MRREKKRTIDLFSNKDAYMDIPPKMVDILWNS